jgi:hypothetical protein
MRPKNYTIEGHGQAVMEQPPYRVLIQLYSYRQVIVEPLEIFQDFRYC